MSEKERIEEELDRCHAGDGLISWLVLLGLTSEEIATISGLRIKDIQKFLSSEDAEDKHEGFVNILFFAQLQAYAEFMCGLPDSSCRQLLGGRALFFQKVLADRLGEMELLERLVGMELGFRQALMSGQWPDLMVTDESRRSFLGHLTERSAYTWWERLLREIAADEIDPLPTGRWELTVLLSQRMSEQRTRFLNQPFTDWTDPKPNVFLRSVDDLELPKRAANCLENADIRLVGELVEKTEQELLRIKNFGRKSLKQVMQALERLGLRIEMKLDPDTRWQVIQRKRGLGTEPLTLKQKLLLPIKGLLPWRDMVCYLQRDAGLYLLGEVVQKTQADLDACSSEWWARHIGRNTLDSVTRLGLSLGMELSPEFQEAIRERRRQLDTERDGPL